MKPFLAITLGDPAGIGPEITVANLQFANEICTPVLFGHWPTFVKTCHDLCHPTDNFCLTKTVQTNESRIQFISTGGPDTPILKPDDDAAQSQLSALESAVSAILNGPCDAITTAPVSKELIARIEPDFTGHTEYLAQRSGLGKDDVTMVFATKQFVVGLISTHIPLAKIPETMTTERYLRTLTHVIQTVKQNISNDASAQIAVAALNPHAGENGLLGKEEKTFLSPFCTTHKNFMEAELFGPIPADAVYRDLFAGKYHGVIAAYHDQALIPLKLGGFGGATNVTAGLPFIRTSPDHGTAYEIAGQQIADSSAMKTAIEMAVHLFNGTA